MENKITNPHDKLFRETWSKIHVARDYFQNYLPEKILKFLDLKSLEIAKDSFIEKELEDYYSDILYKVSVGSEQGYIYLLFEHKSAKDRFVHVQLLGYMIKIWQLHLKQKRIVRLPIIIPIVFYHGRTKWNVETRFLDLFLEPAAELEEFIPDFRFVLHDLTRYSDEDIKGMVLLKAVMLLFRHIFDPDVVDKLPGIFKLFNELIRQESGLANLEALLRYLFTTVDDISVDQIKNMVEQSASNIKEDVIMTLAEKLRSEGYQKGVEHGIQQGMQKGMQQGILKGKTEGLIEGIELAIRLKFGSNPESEKFMESIREIEDPGKLIALKSVIVESNSVHELTQVLIRLRSGAVDC